MGGTDSRELLVDLIGYASIVSAAVFGLIGLFTEYKTDGKITLWGRLAAAGIGLSAVFAMTSAVLQKQLNTEQQQNARKAAATERAHQQKQFDTQLGQLMGLNLQMAGVNRDNRALLGQMETSLEGQQRSLVLTTALGAQQRASTSQVLLGLWNESTRVTPASIKLTGFVTCTAVRPGQDFPRLFRDNAIALVHAVPLAQAEPLRPFDTFNYFVRLPADGISLHSYTPHVSVQRLGELRPGTGERVSEFVSFEAFTSDGAKSLPERPEDWEGLALEVWIFTNSAPGIRQALDAALASPLGGKESLRPIFTVPPDLREDPARPISVLPCKVFMGFAVNNRIIAQGAGLFIHGRNPLAGGMNLAAKFPIWETSRGVFPRFPNAAVAAR